MTTESIPERIRRLWAQHTRRDDAPPVARGPKAVTRGADADGVDEARVLLDRLGGDIWAGDVAEVETSDPTFWKASSFTLSYSVACVALAQTTDPRGAFTFTVLFLEPHQGADVIIIEGDMERSARVFLGVRGPEALRAELAGYRENFLKSPKQEERYSVATDGLGDWTAYQVRGTGHLWVVHGHSDMVPLSAASDVGVAYRDASFYYGPSLATAGWGLRVLEFGGFGHAFQVESLPLGAISIWRRERPVLTK